MGGPKQKGVTSYGSSPSPSQSPVLELTALYDAVVSPFRQAPMRGVVSHWVFNGYKRTLAQAPYFLVPIALGAFLFPCSGVVRGS